MGKKNNKASNDLLGNHPDGRYNARVNWDPVPGPGGIMLGFNVPNGFSMYAEGYKKLADVGVAHIKAHPHDANLVVYPILFCYRQYVELRLKEFVVTASDLLDQKLALPTNHNLRGLWQTVRPLLQKVWGVSEHDDDLASIEDVVEQLSDIDPKSSAFRYPVDTGMNPSLPGITNINIRQVGDVIDCIAPLLDGSSYEIEEHLGIKQEMQADAYQEAAQYAEPPDY